MEFKNEKAEQDWNKTVEANSDPYGKASIDYARTWAELMEVRIAYSEDKIKDFAKELSHTADTDGITGFMYGCAVSILSKVWKHGEELRKWHNLDTQIGTEGEKANESGGCLNPALLNISTK